MESATKAVPWWKAATKKQWYALIAGQAGWALDAFDVLLYVFALTTIMKEWGLSPAAAGFLAATTLFSSAFGGIFFGSKGKAEINRNQFRTNPASIAAAMPKDLSPSEAGHVKNWLDCVRSRKMPRADVEIGHRSISLAHLANITRQLNRKLKWDPKKEHFVGDAEADKMVSRPRRKGYELPNV